MKFSIAFAAFILSCQTKTKIDLRQHIEASISLQNLDDIQSRFIVSDTQLIHIKTNMKLQKGALIPTIFVHGIAGSTDDFSEMMRLLNQKNELFYAIDLPGFGRSIRLNDNIDIISSARLILKLFDVFGGQKYHLVCHSMGGQICLQTTLIDQSRIATLTLLDSAGVYDKSNYVKLTLKNLANINYNVDSKPQMASFSDLNWYNQNFVRKMITNNPNALMAIESFKTNLRRQVNKITIPTLIIWGKNDKIFPLDSGFFLQQSIKNSKFYIIENEGHVPQKNYSKKIVDWIFAFREENRNDQNN